MAQLQIWQIWRAESKTLITLGETEQLLNNSMENKTCFASGTAIQTIAREVVVVYTNRRSKFTGDIYFNFN